MTEKMSADTLRRAAAAMRERAEAATAGPLLIDAMENGEHGLFVGPDRDLESEALGCGGSQVAGWLTEANAHHIASWYPAVALAVADWLDEAADHLDVYEDDDLDPALRPHVCPTAIEGPECSVLGQALTVARAYLGEEA